MPTVGGNRGRRRHRPLGRKVAGAKNRKPDPVPEPKIPSRARFLRETLPRLKRDVQLTLVDKRPAVPPEAIFEMRRQLEEIARDQGPEPFYPKRLEVEIVGSPFRTGNGRRKILVAIMDGQVQRIMIVRA